MVGNDALVSQYVVVSDVALLKQKHVLDIMLLPRPGVTDIDLVLLVFCLSIKNMFL
jgi:hypothetical protein